MTDAPLVTMRGIRKAFGPVEVLHDVDFELLRGEVHVLAGENGAGKSTLINILSGVYDDYYGELVFDGRKRRFRHPIDAANAGIATIHQELSLVPSLSISDNLFLGRESTNDLGLVDYSSQLEKSAAILSDLELDLSPMTIVEELDISVRQLLEIGRALSRDASLLIFDEPTSALSEHESSILFEKISALRGQGRGIVYITHRMEEIYRIADRITVLRDGKVVGVSPAVDLTPKGLVRLMVGRDVDIDAVDSADHSDEPALEVEGLRVENNAVPDRPLVDGFSFELMQGEILGLAGLQGSGASEVLHALFGGLGERASGEARLLGRPLPLRDPEASVLAGIVLLTNDRKASGLAMDLSVLHNASLASLTRFSNRFGWMQRAAEILAVSELSETVGLKAPSLEAPVRELSGGNQQKVYLAKCLMTEPQVLLLDEPTRGVDIGAKSDIYALLRSWVGQGKSIVVITSELEELLELCDRILVLHRGRCVAEFTRETATKDALLAAAMGHQLTGSEAGGREAR